MGCNPKRWAAASLRCSARCIGTGRGGGSLEYKVGRETPAPALCAMTIRRQRTSNSAGRDVSVDIGVPEVHSGFLMRLEADTLWSCLSEGFDCLHLEVVLKLLYQKRFWTNISRDSGRGSLRRRRREMEFSSFGCCCCWISGVVYWFNSWSDLVVSSRCVSHDNGNLFCVPPRLLDYSLESSTK
mmetsp:Transcript_62017/g.166418  ORF Transcript_62017/g.166418 Transcript_62017/m.166418 type:complete len:184 (-) Transcript_62017:340-891(-)